jgi:hypothetical protein
MRRSAISVSDLDHIVSVLRGTVLLISASLLLGTFGLTPDARAQEGPSLRSDRRPVQVAIDPTYQYYRTSNDRVLTQLSTRLAAFVPITQQFSAQVRAGYARMGGDGLTQVRGPTDVSAQVTYAREVGEGSVVFSVAGNAPTGKQKLTDDELRTTRPISRNFYDFRVTSYSRGPSISPQVTVAYPITDQFAIGIGGGYQHQRGFQPNASLASDSLYVPGDGIGGNLGLNYKITESSAVGLSVSFRRYGEDTVDGAPRFDAGSRAAGTLRYLQRSGFTTLRAVLRYSQWEESKFGFRNGQLTRQGQVLPPHGLALVGYETRLVEGIRLQTRLSGHVYRETVSGGRKLFGRAYLAPSFEIGELVTVEPHGTATYGSYLGLGGGVRVVGSF